MGVRSPDAPPTSRSPRPPLTARAQAPVRRTPEEALPAKSDRDVRSKRPPALSFVLRMDTLRRGLRVLSLLALDLCGLSLAIFTALALKAAVLSSFDAHQAYQGTRSILAFAYLLDRLAVRPLGPVCRALPAPGPVEDRRLALPGRLRGARLRGGLGEHFSSYYIFYGSLAFALLYISSFRYLYERATGAILRAAGYQRRAVLVGTGKHIHDVADALADAPNTPIEVVGFVSPEPLPPNGIRSLGTLDHLQAVIAAERVDEVIIADPDFPQERAVDLVDQCHRRGVRVRIAPSTMEILIHRAEFVPGQSVPLFELGPPVFEGIDFALKRTFDAIGSALLLFVLSPLLMAIFLAVRLSSRGPALYRSMRPGIGQRPFACLKFRTMYCDAHEHQSALEELNEADGALFKIKDDPRLTPVGRFLRRFSLDELPQLINVLRGDMSLVGPRPLPERDFELLQDWHRKRYLVLPGITGLWQVSGRSELDFDDLVHLDFIYLERWSLALDLAILLKTIPAVLMQRGAY